MHNKENQEKNQNSSNTDFVRKKTKETTGKTHVKPSEKIFDQEILQKLVD
jgi:hypothetical protein